MFDTVVRNGTLVTAKETFQGSLAIQDGTIAAVLAPDVGVSANTVIDADGKHVLPGGVDPHVHMMDPGQTEREDFPTGTAAAAAGGVTTVGEHHRTEPMVLSADVLQEKRDYLSDRARVDFGLLAGGHPDNVDEIGELEAAGALAYKSFTCEVHGVPALQSADMLELFREVTRVGGISMIHPEDELILESNEEQIRKTGRQRGEVIPEWRSKEAEQVAVATSLQIAKQTGVKLWFAHVSHPELLDQINDAKAQGVQVYAETCPQYLYLTGEDVVADAPYTMFTPPARTAADREELWTRLATGEIDMVNADHAPSTLEQKADGEDDIFQAPFGIPGIETVLPLLLDGVANDKITLTRVAEVFATKPAKILDLHPKKGELRPGADADFVIVDLQRTETITNDAIVAKCGWTPFEGTTVRGWPERTFVRGQLAWEDGDVVAAPGFGKFISRP